MASYVLASVTCIWLRINTPLIFTDEEEYDEDAAPGDEEEDEGEEDEEEEDELSGEVGPH